MSYSSNKSESGMALLMVLGVLSVTMVMIAHIILMVNVLTGESYQISRAASMRYDAESAADTAMWYHFTDRRLFADRTLGKESDNGTRADYDLDAWMLDGKPHYFDGGDTVVYLNNGESGIRVSNLNQLKDGYDASDDADYLDAVNDFIAAYDDYVDTNDEVKIGGYENDDYTNDGFPTLPRNGKMQFKAELYWLPDWENILTTQICVIPPKNIQYTFQSRKQSLFTASASDIMRLLDIEEGSSELNSIIDAIKQWRENGTALEDLLDIDLLTQLKAKFDFSEGNLAICHAEAYDANHEIHATYRVIREAKLSSSRSIFADRKGECLSIWERFRE